MRNAKTFLLWLAIVAIAGGVSLWQKSDDPASGRTPVNDPPVVVATAGHEASPGGRQSSEELRRTRRSEEPAARAEGDWPRVHQLVTDDVEREQLLRTLELIERGGPFPYPKKDGSTFSNRERRLPSKAKGYYREYTVPTPGASNRGTRRVVQGRSGETYYTNDHYDSFLRLDAE